MTTEDGPSLEEWLYVFSRNLARFETELETYLAAMNKPEVRLGVSRERKTQNCVDERPRPEFPSKH